MFDLPTLLSLELSYPVAVANKDLIMQHANAIQYRDSVNVVMFGFPSKEAYRAVGQVLFPENFPKVDREEHNNKWWPLLEKAWTESPSGFWLDKDLHYAICLKCYDPESVQTVFRLREDIKCKCGQSISKAAFDLVPTGTVLTSETPA